MAAPATLEIALLDEFRKRLTDLNLQGEQDSDMFLLRWIRARDNKLGQAEEMLRKSIIWRKENDLTGWEPPEILKDGFLYELIGYDEDNSPVLMVQGGRYDYRKVVENGLQEEFLKFKQTLYDQTLELMRGKMTKENVPVTQAVVIMDLEHSSFRQFNLQVLSMTKEDSSRFEANYPEIVKAIYLINEALNTIHSPWFLNVLINIMKSILPARTMGKLNAFSGDSTKWMPVLQGIVPLENLPVLYGGSNDKSKLNNPI